MHINSMVSVKDAAAILGCDKKYVREKLEQGQLKGEKRLDGGKEKWFVQKKAVDEELAKMPIVTPTGTYQLDANGQAQVASEAVIEPVEVTARRRRRTARAAKGDNDLFFGIDVETVDVPVVEESIARGSIENRPGDHSTIEHMLIEDSGVSRAVLEQSSMVQSAADHPKGLTFERTQARTALKDFSSFSEEFFEDYYEEEHAEALPDVSGQPLLTVMQAMVKAFSMRIEQHRQVNSRLVQELEEKSLQLRLLPDLQKKADEVYKLEFEAAALKLQISCMERQHFDTAVLLERAETEAIPQLESRLEEEYRMHSIEVARLRDQLQQYALRVQQSEIDKHSVVELEAALHEMVEQQEKMKRLAQAEIDRVRNERDAEFRKLARDAERVWKEKDQALKRLANDAERINEQSTELARIAEEAVKERLAKEMELERLREEAIKFKREKEFELELLADEADLISHEKKIAQANLDERLSQIARQEQSIAKLEAALREATEIKERETEFAKAEAERVACEMGVEIATLNERLTNITEQMEAAKMPWWRRLFMPTA
ncbi:MAG: hypothetical protein SGJ27_10835 [Candidatus Melainabacteria bacterium]|nr:hypothetical protein [Candidatus Melainabacteria bacterium]